MIVTSVQSTNHGIMICQPAIVGRSCQWLHDRYLVPTLWLLFLLLKWTHKSSKNLCGTWKHTKQQNHKLLLSMMKIDRGGGEFLKFSESTMACRWSQKSSAAVVAPSSATSRDYHKTSRRTRPSTSTCLSAGHPTSSGNAARADPESDESTRSGRTMGFPRRTCGGVRLVLVTEEQRYGPCWLRDDDDDDYV